MSNKIRIGIATYDEVIDSLKDSERWLIDVRDSKEIVDAGQIPTSINIPLENIFDELRLSAPAFSAKYERAKPGLYDEIIFYCKYEDRSQAAADLAIKAGYRNVKNYRGGWSEWTYKWVEFDEWIDQKKLTQQEDYKHFSG